MTGLMSSTQKTRIDGFKGKCPECGRVSVATTEARLSYQIALHFAAKHRELIPIKRKEAEG